MPPPTAARTAWTTRMPTPHAQAWPPWPRIGFLHRDSTRPKPVQKCFVECVQLLKSCCFSVLFLSRPGNKVPGPATARKNKESKNQRESSSQTSRKQEGPSTDESTSEETHQTHADMPQFGTTQLYTRLLPSLLSPSFLPVPTFPSILHPLLIPTPSAA